MERIVDDGAEDLDVHGRNDSTSETVALYKAMALKFEALSTNTAGGLKTRGRVLRVNIWLTKRTLCHCPANSK